MKTQSDNEATKVLADSGRGGQSVHGTGTDSVNRVRFGGLTTICHARSSTLGSAALLEHILEPHCLGAPPHRHTSEDEISFVISGQLVVLQDGETSTAGAGQTILKPRGVMHTFWNPGDEPVRFLEVIAPGSGFERYFEEVAPLIPDGREPDVPGIMGVAARYGLEFDMSAVPGLLAAYKLRF